MVCESILYVVLRCKELNSHKFALTGNIIVEKKKSKEFLYMFTIKLK